MRGDSPKPSHYNERCKCTRRQAGKVGMLYSLGAAVKRDSEMLGSGERVLEHDLKTQADDGNR
jgi:hypothetical protein